MVWPGWYGTLALEMVAIKVSPTSSIATVIEMGNSLFDLPHSTNVRPVWDRRGETYSTFPSSLPVSTTYSNGNIGGPLHQPQKGTAERTPSRIWRTDFPGKM
ncbi:hypothetical protein KP509_32G057600 [Ceratopteris richardii]|uniref:Uncharacterized protein n=1 Tax=Ceratopteris richardii TaxID=49495 RepID=A0A8T2QVV5_CERRI|nr:hypothetical protein KP509_32G057600 [Ceratopteris richardii]